MLDALASSNFDNRKNFGLYQNELNGINSGENTPDFLEILPWNRIGKIAELLSSLSPADLIGNSEDNQSIVQTKYNQYCHEIISNFVNELQLLLNSVDTRSQTRSLLLTSRKVLGLPRNKIDMAKVINLLTLASNSGSLPENDLILVQYPGAFLPYPHKAHLELAQKTFDDLSPPHMAETRIVVNTFEKNNYRSDKAPVFKTRIKNLHMGFALQEFVTVLGVSGDSDRQFKQMEIVSRFSSDKTINYLCGSDTIIKKVQFALDGDPRAQKLFNNSTNFMVSIRPNENMEKLELAIKMAEKIEGSNITILPSVRSIDLSGTEIRQSIDGNKCLSNIYPNQFIEEAYSN